MTQDGTPVRGARHINNAADFEKAFAVSRETLDRLRTYEALLLRWQKTINLVAPSTLAQVWHRHFADSAQLVQYATTSLTACHDDARGGERHWLDLGSGAGFPGLVAAVMLVGQGGQPLWRFTLVESDTRKAAFLMEVVRKLGLSQGKLVEILPQRIESVTTHTRLQRVDVVSARALAPLVDLLELSLPFFGPETVGFYLKGRDAEAEFGVARQRFEFSSEMLPSVTDAAARIVKVASLKLAERGG